MSPGVTDKEAEIGVLLLRKVSKCKFVFKKKKVKKVNKSGEKCVQL